VWVLEGRGGGLLGRWDGEVVVLGVVCGGVLGRIGLVAGPGGGATVVVMRRGGTDVRSLAQSSGRPLKGGLGAGSKGVANCCPWWLMQLLLLHWSQGGGLRGPQLYSSSSSSDSSNSSGGAQRGHPQPLWRPHSGVAAAPQQLAQLMSSAAIPAAAVEHTAAAAAAAA